LVPLYPRQHCGSSFGLRKIVGWQKIHAGLRCKPTLLGRQQVLYGVVKKSTVACGVALVENVEDGVEFTNTIGYPVVLRPAYTLGGSGGGIAHNQVELEEILENGLRLSRVGQVLVERCIAGWKEIEYEVMRDSAGNCITVCNMENIDPVGVHTGDSIVVAPSQTLSDKEYQMLRTSALKIINELQITGGCNVQYDDRYHVVEAKMPCLITALSELNKPRYMTPGGIFDACKAEITTWGRADLKDVDDSNLGLKGSPTKIAKASDKVRKGAGEKIVPDSPEDGAAYIVAKFKEKHII
jgi:hypothetical protein